MRTSRAVVRIALLSVVATPLQGQQRRESTDVHLRNACRLAAQVMQTGHPDPQFDWAVSVIGRCDESGPPALAAAWQRAAPDTHVLGMLTYTSQRLRDQRIVTAALDALRDGSRPQIVRLSAVATLISYAAAQPWTTTTLADLLRAGAPPRGLSITTEFVARDGAEPVAPDARQAIMSTLADLAANDADPVVRKAAAWVHDELPKP